MTQESEKNPHAQALGSLGGKSTSDAKKAAARLNGKKGGRPRKKSGDKALQGEEPTVR